MANGIRIYNIDFFQISHKETPDYPTVWSVLQDIFEDDEPAVYETNGFTRDIWGMHHRAKPASFTGQFRKFRTQDLPEIGEAGAKAEEIELEENQGIVERNFFVFYQEHNILGWHRNAHGNHPGQFAKFLQEHTGTLFSVDPVLQPDAVRRLMSGNVDVRKVVVSIPRPTSPDAFPDDKFNKAIFDMMSGVKADSLHIELGIDGRRSGMEKHLAPKIKRSMKELIDFGATTAKVFVNDDDGYNHPIDLIADRVSSAQEIETNKSYPPPGSMYKLIDKAKAERQGALDGYFGTGRNALT